MHIVSPVTLVVEPIISKRHNRLHRSCCLLRRQWRRLSHVGRATLTDRVDRNGMCCGFGSSNEEAFAGLAFETWLHREHVFERLCHYEKDPRCSHRGSVGFVPPKSDGVELSKNGRALLGDRFLDLLQEVFTRGFAQVLAVLIGFFEIIVFEDGNSL